jgi:curved DNA-binding protein CbpA
MRDFYEILQVHRRAEPEVIRAAYRILAHKYHPDHGGDPARMAALNDAWDVLGDPVRRAAYDSSLAAGGSAYSASAYSGSAYSGSSYAPASSGGQGGDVAHAGPPPGRPSGTVLDFGRYSGWSLGEIARHDLGYLEWLQRATVGRRLRAEIDAILREKLGSQYVPPTQGFRGHR